MDKLDLQEKLLGGIFGVVAIIAAIAEMFVGGVNAASICGMIKDVFGTLVVVVVMISVAKMITPKKYNLSFEERLTKALEEWMKQNSNMISRTTKMPKGHENDFGMSMKTDMHDFYNDAPTTTRSGWFVRLPEIKTENYNNEKIAIDFHLNSETFFGRGHGLSDEELATKFDHLSNLFAQFIKSKFSGFASATGKGDSLKVYINQPIYTDDDIATLIDLINTAYTAYLVSSHIKAK